MVTISPGPAAASGWSASRREPIRVVSTLLSMSDPGRPAEKAYAPVRRDESTGLAVVVVSFESRIYLEQCLEVWRKFPHTLVVVDNASTDGSAHAARLRTDRVLELERNVGFGAAANAGIAATTEPFVLVTNADAWPKDDAPAGLLRCVERDATIGALGPALVGDDGRPQPTRLPMPSRWWTGRPAVTTRPRAVRFTPRLPFPQSRGHFLVGAALLLRRETLERVGGFDPAFFLFNEELDLCRRIVAAGWRLETCPEATFVHVGGVSMRPRWNEVYREQLRGHLRLVRKHEGRRAAERARRWLTLALRLRAAGRGRRGRTLREAADWLGSHSLEELLDAGL